MNSAPFAEPNWQALYDTAASQDGLFTTRQAAAAGYSDPLLAHHQKVGRIVRIRRGIYRLVHFPTGEQEELVSAWLWTDAMGVLSHQTALSLHGLSDALPAQIHLTLPLTWRQRRLRVPKGIVLHYADVPAQDRSWNGAVPVTSTRRTLNDCALAGLSPDLLRQATKQALARGLVTKAVSVEPRSGAPAPRVAEFAGGMINAVGLANPGLDAVQRDQLPWLAAHLRRARVLVNVIGTSVDDFVRVLSALDTAPGVAGFELNVSCPNVRRGGMEFGADAAVLADLVSQARRATRRPLFVKLSPTLVDIAATARVAVDAGADGITVVNTIPGLLIDVERRRPVLGFGTGGVSGPAILPVGVLATWKVSRAVQVPIVGVGGIASTEDVVQYLLAGASLVGVGTAALQDPRLPERLVHGLGAWCAQHGIHTLQDVVGRLEWPA